MKTQFNVPIGRMTEFASLLGKHELSNEISGASRVGEIIVSVEYEKNERDEVDELIDLLEGEHDDDSEEDEEEEDN